MAAKFRINGIKKHSMVNGPGVRYVVFMQGCIHHCPACQNPDTHDPKGGEEADTDDVISDILRDRYLDGVTLSGGDPLLQPEAAAQIAEACSEAGINVWVYTGWTFEELMGRIGIAAHRGTGNQSDAGNGNGEQASDCNGSDGSADAIRRLLEHTDVLVDGRYVDALRSEDFIWRGSTNQRLISAKVSIARGAAVLYDRRITQPAFSTDNGRHIRLPAQTIASTAGTAGFNIIDQSQIPFNIYQ